MPSGASDSSAATTRWSMLDRLHGTDAEAAWAWFIDRYRPAIRRTLTAMLGPQVGEQVIDGFWGFLFESNALARVDHDRRFRFFLYGIVRNYARRCLPSRDASDATASDVVARDDSPSVAEDLIWAAHTLDLALERMQNEYPGDALALRCFYGLSQSRLDGPQLAEKLGCKVNAIHQLLHRARRRLRDAIVSEIRETVHGDADLADEVQRMLGALKAERPGLVLL